MSSHHLSDSMWEPNKIAEEYVLALLCADHTRLINAASTADKQGFRELGIQLSRQASAVWVAMKTLGFKGYP